MESNSVLKITSTFSQSFKLKPASVTRPNVQGPRTNLKVAAILEKANAIRQVPPSISPFLSVVGIALGMLLSFFVYMPIFFIFTTDMMIIKNRLWLEVMKTMMQIIGAILECGCYFEAIVKIILPFS